MTHLPKKSLPCGLDYIAAFGLKSPILICCCVNMFYLVQYKNYGKKTMPNTESFPGISLQGVVSSKTTKTKYRFQNSNGLKEVCQYLQLRLSEIFSPPKRLQAFGLKHALVECQPLLHPQWLTVCSLFLSSSAVTWLGFTTTFPHEMILLYK